VTRNPTRPKKKDPTSRKDPTIKYTVAVAVANNNNKATPRKLITSQSLDKQDETDNKSDKEIDTAENKRPIQQQGKLRQSKRLQNSKLRSTKNVNQGTDETQETQAADETQKRRRRRQQQQQQQHRRQQQQQQQQQQFRNTVIVTIY